jgi:hypothetical protein
MGYCRYKHEMVRLVTSIFYRLAIDMYTIAKV